MSIVPHFSIKFPLGFPDLGMHPHHPDAHIDFVVSLLNIPAAVRLLLNCSNMNLGTQGSHWKAN